MQITALAGGIGGARFLRGLRDALDADPALAQSDLTVIANTGDDITLFGLRVDTLLYTLGGGNNEAQGWGRDQDSYTIMGELSAYGVGPQWFGLGDKDLGTHIARSLWLGEGATPTQITARLAQRWGLPDQHIRLLPMSDSPVETHVVVTREHGPEAIHFQQWWVGERAQTPAKRTWSSCRRAIRWCPSASFWGSPGCAMPCAERRRRWSGSPPSSVASRCAATPTPA